MTGWPRSCTRRSGLLPALIGLLATAATGLAQEADLAPEVLAPIEDLQGHFHLSADDVVAILSAQSLMLTHAAVQRIEDAKKTARKATREHEQFAALTVGAAVSAPLEISDLQLGAILYLSASSWSFWLNGQAVTPQSLPTGIAVLAVRPNRVELSWTPDPTRPGDVRRVAFAPGQTYLFGSAQVVESGETQPGAASVDAVDDQGVDGTTEDNSANAAGGGNSSAGTNAAPGLALSSEQADQIGQLQQALSIVSGNAAAVGMTEDELAQLQSSLAAAGDTGSLTAEQQQQLARIRQATGMGQ